MSLYNEKIFSRSEWLWIEYHNLPRMKERLVELKKLVEHWKQKGWSGDVWNEEIEYCKSKMKHNGNVDNCKICIARRTPFLTTWDKERIVAEIEREKQND